MKITPEQLQISIKKNGLLPVYVISGDEPLLMQETADHLRNACRAQGYDERVVFEVDGKFNWNSFTEEAGSMSLFSQLKIIELRLKSGKLNKDGAASVQNYLKLATTDTVLIIQSPKMERAETNKKWFKEADSLGGIVTIWPIDSHKLPQWIQARARKEGLELSQDALELLIERTEGNLLATAQELQKLALLTDNKNIDATMILNAVAESARYAVFDLVNSILDRDTAKSLHILNHLLAEGVQPTIILWALTRQMRQLFEINQSREALAKIRLPPKTKNALQRYTSQVTRKDINTLVEHSHLVDKCIKGSKEKTIEEALSQLVLKFCQPALAL